jgi:hypothetical protein
MPPREKPIVAGMRFPTREALLRYAKSRRDHIGVTLSVKSSSPTDLDFFYELLQRHPEADLKLENFDDFMICDNEIGSGLEMRVVRSDSLPPRSFSLPTCVTGRATGAKPIIGAMRFAIVDQITHFKQTAPPLCALCSQPASHADHVIHFEQLVYNFLKQHTPPTKFGRAVANQYCFLADDDAYETLWRDYHYRHAELRHLCSQCNLTRPRWTGENGDSL